MHKIAEWFKSMLSLARLKDDLSGRLDSDLGDDNLSELKKTYIALKSEEDRYLQYLQIRYFLKKLHSLEINQIAESMKCILDCRTNDHGKVVLAHSD
jgi:hypothetical protein